MPLLINQSHKQMPNNWLRLCKIDPPRSPCFSSNGLARSEHFASILLCLARAVCHPFTALANNFAIKLKRSRVLPIFQKGE